MSALAELVVGGDAHRWRALGLTVDGDAGSTGAAVVGSVRVRFVEGRPGIRSLGFVDVPAQLVDGVEIGPAEPAEPAPASAHALGASRVDHVVVMTPDLERTCGAVEAALGAPLKRVRDAGRGVVQGFFRLGEVILEVVQSPQVPPGPAALWGLVLVVDDLEGACERLGPDVIGLPRPAVQPGRFIASVRDSAGLGLPVALMSA